MAGDSDLLSLKEDRLLVGVVVSSGTITLVSLMLGIDSFLLGWGDTAPASEAVLTVGTNDQKKGGGEGISNFKQDMLSMNKRN